MFRSRSAAVAAGTALLGALGFLAAALVFTTIPENPPGDGFAAGLAGIFVILYAVIALLALAEAGALYLVTRLWNPTERVRRLLTAGALCGGFAVGLTAGPTLAHRLLVAVRGGPVLVGGDVFLSLGLSLAPLAVVCSALGVILQAVDTVRTAHRA